VLQCGKRTIVGWAGGGPGGGVAGLTQEAIRCDECVREDLCSAAAFG
jgi:hypothetical protein